MLKILNRKLRSLCSRLGWPLRRRPKTKIVIKRFGKSNSRPPKHEIQPPNPRNSSSAKPEKAIRIATLNAAFFSVAPAVPSAAEKPPNYDLRAAKSVNDRPKGILKQSPLHPNSANPNEAPSKQQRFSKSKLRVSINLPDNEISLRRNGKLSSGEGKEGSSKAIARILKGKGQLRASMSMPLNRGGEIGEIGGDGEGRIKRTVVDVLRELDADVVGLQDVKAEEERSMKPLSELAGALGMNYVFAESWAPEYGNAVLSRWPIKRWKVHKIFDDSDFRNVLSVTIDVPGTGELNFQCTHLDHLDENWRMKQIKAIIQCSDGPHILAGGLNSLDETDYSPQRWSDIVKYYEELGKPTPKVEVMKFLKSKDYTDAKDFAGECESVVIIAKGQSVQGTCKYGTRVDYILASPNSPYKFVPGSYSVLSSKGTSDHHIVKVDMLKVTGNNSINAQPPPPPQSHLDHKKARQTKQKIIRITNSSTARGIWRHNTDSHIDR